LRGSPGPVVVPASAWQHPDVRSALQGRDVSRLLRLIQKYTGASQGQLGAAFGRTQPEVHRYLRGRQRAISLDVWEALADGLNMPDEARLLLGLAPRGVTVSNADADDLDRLARAMANPRRVDASVVEYLKRTLADQRHVEDVVGPRPMISTARAEADLIASLLPQTRERVRADLLRVGSQYAQFLGWMHTDTGENEAALCWYDRAMEWAQEVNDPNMVVSVLSLKSHQAWGTGDPVRALGLAQAGQENGCEISAGVRALIVQQEARTHAVLGEADHTERKLAEAEELTVRAGDHFEDQPPWIYFHSPERFILQRGLAYSELGRTDEAIDLLTTGIDLLPDGYRRDRAWYLARLSVAYARSAEVESACAIGRDAAALAAEVGSGHAISDLRTMRERLDHQRRHAAVLQFDEAIRSLT